MTETVTRKTTDAPWPFAPRQLVQTTDDTHLVDWLVDAPHGAVLEDDDATEWTCVRDARGSSGWETEAGAHFTDVELARHTSSLRVVSLPGAVKLTSAECKALPDGTEVVDAYGYWRGRTYVKTGYLSWAYFRERPTPDQVREALKERRNNLSPGPFGYLVHVYKPGAFVSPSTAKTPASTTPPPTTPAPATAAIERAARERYENTRTELDDNQPPWSELPASERGLFLRMAHGYVSAATADLEPIARAIHATRDPRHRNGLTMCAAGPKSPNSCWAMAEAARTALLGGGTHG